MKEIKFKMLSPKPPKKIVIRRIMKEIKIKISDEIYAKFLEVCKKKKISMGAYIENLLVDHVYKEEKNKNGNYSYSDNNTVKYPKDMERRTNYYVD